MVAAIDPRVPPAPNEPAAPGSRARGRLWEFAAGLAVAVATGCLYWAQLRPDCDFVNLDDPRLVEMNPAIRAPSPATFCALFREPLKWWQTDGFVPRLTAGSLMLDSWLGGPEYGPQPHVFHRTSVLLHVLNTVLVFGLMRRLHAGVWSAAALALLFGAHPIQVEAVAWVSRRGVLLGATFSLMAIRCYLQIPGRGGFAWFIAANLLALVASTATPNVVALPLVFLLLDWWPLGRLSMGAIFEKTPLMAIFAFGPLAALLRESAMWPNAAGKTAGLMVRNFGVLLDRLVWPHDLSPIYPSISASLVAFGWNVLAVGVTVGMIVAGRRRMTAVSVGLAGFTLLLLPMLRPAPDAPGLIRDHAAYLPLVLLLFPVADWILKARDARIGTGAVFACAAACAFVTVPQSARWRNGESLFQYTASLYPDAAAPKEALAEWLGAHDRLGEALSLFQQAVLAEPERAAYHYEFGQALLKGKDENQALREFSEAVRLEPANAWFQLADAASLGRMRQWEAARQRYEMARDLAPRLPEIRMGLGFTYLELKRPAAARAEFQTALSYRPSEPLVHLGLACSWAEMHELDRCREHLSEAVALDPSIAMRAGREPALRRLAGRPGFEHLIVLPTAKKGGR